MMTTPDAESSSRKRGRLGIELGKPLLFEEDTTSSAMADTLAPDEKAIGDAVRAYHAAARALLAGQYRELARSAPPHLTQPCNIAVFICSDGTVVRYDAVPPGESETKVRVLPIPKTLAEWAPLVTDNLVHFPSGHVAYAPEAHGPALVLEHVNLTTGESVVLDAAIPMLLAQSTFPAGTPLPAPPRKPPALVAITNEIEITMDGYLAAEPNGHATRVDRVVDVRARQIARIAAGWVAIEIFPKLDASHWKPEYAAMWAESDLLSAFARAKLTDTEYAALDPHVEARKRIAQLLAELESLLAGPEEPIHQFLKLHPELLSMTHAECWSKLPFGERFSDFVFREPDGRYLLVELEGPQHLLFRKDGHARQALNHAIGQIADWRTYLEANLSEVQTRLGLRGITSNPEALIVIGRSAQLTTENRAKLATLQGQMPRLRIMTYDDLIAHIRSVAANLFGSADLETTGELYIAPPRKA